VFVNISLELTIKLDGTNLQVGAVAGGPSGSVPGRQEDKVNWAIPDFSSDKIEFGK
jgi:hypothetical protein